MIRRLLLLALLLPALAGAQTLRVGDGTMPATATTSSVTWSGAGTPTSALVLITSATADDTTAANVMLGCGVTDFTTTAAVGTFMEDNVTPTDSRRIHDDGNVVSIDDDGGTALVTATITTTTDGVQLTRGEAGAQYRYLVVASFDTAAKAFSEGAGTLTTGTFNVAHGLGRAPGAGIYCYDAAEESAGAEIQGAMSFGFSAGLTQRAFAFRMQDGQADGEAHAQLFSDRVAVHISNTGDTFHEVELTTSDATNQTFTAYNNTAGDLIGILYELDGIIVDLDTVNSPNSTGSWTYSAPGFAASTVILVATQAEAIDTAYSDDPRAGTVAWFATDFTDEYGVAVMDENGANPADTASRFANELWLGDDDQTEDYACNTFASTGSGFSATCDTADATTNRWIALTIGTAATGAAQWFWRRR